MDYPDGQPIRLGDEVTISGKPGLVVCSFDDRAFSARFPASEWDHHVRGVLIEFTDWGLFLFDDAPDEDLLLKRRASPPRLKPGTSDRA